MQIRELARQIIAREGGFVNDPDDPGGATKHGVTVHTLRNLGVDLDEDGVIDGADVRRLTAERAAEILIAQHYERPGIGALPEVLRASVFDMHVNAGANAIRILQRLLRQMGHRVAIDGVIGPQTIAAAEAARDAGAKHLADAYGIARRNYYYRLGDARPKSRKYATRKDGGKGGWIRRAEAFISPRYHLTDAEHRERVASWA